MEKESSENLLYSYKICFTVNAKYWRAAEMWDFIASRAHQFNCTLSYTEIDRWSIYWFSPTYNVAMRSNEYIDIEHRTSMATQIKDEIEDFFETTSKNYKLIGKVMYHYVVNDN